jgi:hypothetical protein
MRRKLAALVALTTTACTTWQVQPGPSATSVQTASESQSGRPLRLIFRGGAFADIYEPRLVGDSIIGMSGPTSQATRQRVAFATADVQSVAANKVSVGRTVLAVAAIGLAVLIIAGAGSSSSSSSSSSNSSCASARTPIAYVA